MEDEIDIIPQDNEITNCYPSELLIKLLVYPPKTNYNNYLLDLLQIQLMMSARPLMINQFALPPPVDSGNCQLLPSRCNYLKFTAKLEPLKTAIIILSSMGVYPNSPLPQIWRNK